MKDLELKEVVGLALEEIDRKAQEAKENAGAKLIEDKIFAELARLGGKTFNDDDILFEGTQLIIPENMSISQAQRFLEKKLKELEKVTTFSNTFNYRPWDGAYSMWNVLKRTFGAVAHKDSIEKTMFGKMEAPPKMFSIPIGVNKREQVPWGRFELPFLPGVLFETEGFAHREKGSLFHLTATGPKKYRFEIQGIFALIERELEANSMYRGKAFDGQDMPEFIDVHSVDRNRVVYSEEVMTQLEANIWAQLRHTGEFEKLGIPLKRAVLIHGPFGTGKTLAALLTGQEAIANGWTFIKARPGRDDLAAVLQTARLYEPSVVFYEDIDQIASSDDGGIQKLLDDFDGIEAKGTRILCVLTTNYPEKIHKGMARPGRLDAMIEINELDQQGVERLVRTRIEDMLAEEIDWADVFEAAREYKPAFVTEAADRTIRYLVAQNGTADGMLVETHHLVSAMEGLRPQYDVMTGAKDHAERDPLSTVLERSIARVVQEHGVDYDTQGAPLRPIDEYVER